VFDKDVPGRRMLELNRIGGVVRDGEGEPVPNAWVVLSDVGFATSDADGRFFFSRVNPGEHTCMARGPDGSEAQGKFTVPGGTIDLTLGRASGKRARTGTKSS
jgi:protocatechuate 3,4-dioxygenase beta subunit